MGMGWDRTGRDRTLQVARNGKNERFNTSGKYVILLRFIKNICPNSVIPQLIQVCRNDTPNLLLPAQHQFDKENLSIGPTTQYEKAGINIMAGKWTIVFIVFLIPIEVQRVIRA